MLADKGRDAPGRKTGGPRKALVSNIRRVETLLDVIGCFGFTDAMRLYALRSIDVRRDVDAVFRGIPLRLRGGTPDYRVAYDSLGSEFEPLKRALSPDFDGLIIDAGGYIGTAAIKFAQMFPAARVVCLEPSTENFRILAWNVSRFPNIVPLNRALHPEGGRTLALRRSAETEEWGFSMVEHGGNHPFEEVGTVSLAELYADHADGREIGLVKLDIEGAECAILEQNADLLDVARVVVVELHDHVVPGCTAAFEAFSRGRVILSLPGEKLISVRSG